MQGTNCFTPLVTEYKGKQRKPTKIDSKVETNIIGENTIQLFISGDNIKTIGRDNSDGITETDFLMDMHVVRQLVVISISKTGTEHIKFNTIHGSNIMPSLGSHHTSPKQNIHDIHIGQGHAQPEVL